MPDWFEGPEPALVEDVTAGFNNQERLGHKLSYHIISMHVIILNKLSMRNIISLLMYKALTTNACFP